MSERKQIAIGPESGWPTWTWVGFDLVRALCGHYDVEVFDRNFESNPAGKLPACDAAIAVKFPLPLRSRRLSNLKNIVYFPCDYYTSRKQIERDPFLKKCSCVFSHSRHLAGLLKSIVPNVFEVNHTGRYVLPEMNPYRKDGFILWTGFSHHIPHLRRWLTEHPLENELVLLTDMPGRKYVPGKVLQMQWTPRRQFEAMSQAKAAIDIKGNSFNQLIRAPEKLQTFIASGIPSACNRGPMSDYFRDCGFDVCAPDQPGRWFSKEYYEETVQFGRNLRKEMSLEHVGNIVKNVLDGIFKNENGRIFGNTGRQ